MCNAQFFFEFYKLFPIATAFIVADYYIVAMCGIRFHIYIRTIYYAGYYQPANVNLAFIGIS